MAILSTLKMYLKRTKHVNAPTDLYAHSITLLNGETLDLGSLHGKPALIVNTASKCGFTPHYAGLQALHEKYADQGLQVIGFPSADFNDQEFHDNSEIGDFCQKNYGVTFPLSQETSVRAQPDPLWADIARQPDSAPPVWNFTKYLVGADGKLIKRWATKVKPEDDEIVTEIEKALAA